MSIIVSQSKRQKNVKKLSEDPHKVVRSHEFKRQHNNIINNHNNNNNNNNQYNNKRV